MLHAANVAKAFAEAVLTIMATESSWFLWEVESTKKNELAASNHFCMAFSMNVATKMKTQNAPRAD